MWHVRIGDQDDMSWVRARQLAQLGIGEAATGERAEELAGLPLAVQCESTHLVPDDYDDPAESEREELCSAAEKAGTAWPRLEAAEVRRARRIGHGRVAGKGM